MFEYFETNKYLIKKKLNFFSLCYPRVSMGSLQHFPQNWSSRLPGQLYSKYTNIIIWVKSFILYRFTHIFKLQGLPNLYENILSWIIFLPKLKRIILWMKAFVYLNIFRIKEIDNLSQTLICNFYILNAT